MRRGKQTPSELWAEARRLADEYQRAADNGTDPVRLGHIGWLQHQWAAAARAAEACYDRK